ncbi:microtubule-associated protein tau-like isoform X3 [Bombyx mandarina]|uniref:Microtubule-associated protein n=1 Tax=Bombyx mandarina TaxID=7092 RepID=A0A6J2JAH0_BOMMA|nr:microtubule-associated protein tau-like isoform X3 [Bombyx mandarina]
MEANNASRATAESVLQGATTGTVGSDLSGSAQPPPIRPLIRTDSRPNFAPQARPAAPQQGQLRPNFQPGGLITGPQSLGPRSGVSAPRNSVPSSPLGPQQVRPPPLRPFGPQSIVSQPGPRPQSPTLRAPPPNSLQFGPRQPVSGNIITPDGNRPLATQLPNGANKNGAPPGPGQLPRQPSQGAESFGINKNKVVNLENQSDNKNENQNGKEADSFDAPGMAKGRSYSIAAAPGAPSPLKAEDDRRKSVSAIGGRLDEFGIRSPGLGLIQEGKDSKDNLRSSKESIRSVSSNDGVKDVVERPESRLSATKMTDSFIGCFPAATASKKVDDDDDVISQNNGTSGNIYIDSAKAPAKEDLSERSPSLTRSDDSPEPKQNLSQSSISNNKSQTITPEPQRPKTPKNEIKAVTPTHIKSQVNNDPKFVATPTKVAPKSPIPDTKPPKSATQKPNELNTSIISSDSKKSTPHKSASAPKSRQKEGDNDSGVDESTQGNDLNGSPSSPNKKIVNKTPTKEKSSNSLRASLSRSSSKSATAKTPEIPTPTEKKKVPMNKVQVGNAPSPNLKAVKSKIGSLDNATYKPGGGKVKIENRKLEFGNITPKIAAKNEAYTPSGGAKKIVTNKLEWNAKSKVGSLQNASYKPGGGDKKIETVKLDFGEKAKSKVGSTANITHKPGGGAIKDYYESEWEEDRPISRCRSARTPRTPRALSPRRHLPELDEVLVQRNNDRNRRAARPVSARDPPRSSCSRRASITQRPAFSIY